MEAIGHGGEALKETGIGETATCQIPGQQTACGESGANPWEPDTVA